MPGTLQARLAIAAVAALVAWAAVATLARAQPAQVDALSVTGAVRLASDHDGTATLLADHLVPGGSASGTVRLANTGDADGLVELAQTGVTDVPGAGGGRLSQVLRLRVDDVTAGAPVVLSDGPLTGLTQLPIGRLAAGGTRVLRLTATLPATSGNTLQGASVRMDWTWGAVSVAPQPGRDVPRPRHAHADADGHADAHARPGAHADARAGWRHDGARRPRSSRSRRRAASASPTAA